MPSPIQSFLTALSQHLFMLTPLSDAEVKAFQDSLITLQWNFQKALVRNSVMSMHPLLGAHNAYNSAAVGAPFPNHVASLKQLLEMGVEVLELDVHRIEENGKDNFILCHGDQNFCLANPFKQNYFSDALTTISDFIDQHPDTRLIVKLEVVGIPSTTISLPLGELIYTHLKDKIQFNRQQFYQDQEKIALSWPRMKPVTFMSKHTIIHGEVNQNTHALRVLTYSEKHFFDSSKGWGKARNFNGTEGLPQLEGVNALIEDRSIPLSDLMEGISPSGLFNADLIERAIASGITVFEHDFLRNPEQLKPFIWSFAEGFPKNPEEGKYLFMNQQGRWENLGTGKKHALCATHDTASYPYFLITNAIPQEEREIRLSPGRFPTKDIIRLSAHPVTREEAYDACTALPHVTLANEMTRGFLPYAPLNHVMQREAVTEAAGKEAWINADLRYINGTLTVSYHTTHENYNLFEAGDHSEAVKGTLPLEASSLTSTLYTLIRWKGELPLLRPLTTLLSAPSLYLPLAFAAGMFEPEIRAYFLHQSIKASPHPEPHHFHLKDMLHMGAMPSIPYTALTSYAVASTMREHFDQSLAHTHASASKEHEITPLKKYVFATFSALGAATITTAQAALRYVINPTFVAAAWGSVKGLWYGHAETEQLTGSSIVSRVVAVPYEAGKAILQHAPGYGVISATLQQQERDFADYKLYVEKLGKRWESYLQETHANDNAHSFDTWQNGLIERYCDKHGTSRENYMTVPYRTIEAWRSKHTHAKEAEISQRV